MKFLNHASFLIEDNDFRLVIDPWFKGDVFNKGWNLLYETTSQNLGEMRPSAIWISHEHPDHFNIGTLLDIPPLSRGAVTIYIRETNDKRVVNWCRNNGFSVMECPDGEEVILTEALKFRVFPIGIEDSAALFEVRGTKFLNLNDCLFISEDSLVEFAERVGQVDYVGYLCGYAEGGGTRVDAGFRERLFELHMQRFEWVGRAFRSARVFGFAAFKHFSHQENSFQNDRISFGHIRQLIKGSPGRFGLVAPGDGLDEINDESSLNACDFWELRIKNNTPLHLSSVSIPAVNLVDSASRLFQRITGIGLVWLRVAALLPERYGLAPLMIGVSDLGVSLELSIWKGVRLHQRIESCHEGAILVSSDALQHALFNDFGLSTLMINGRFQASDSGRRKLHRWSVLGLLCSSKERLGISFFYRYFFRIIKNLRA